MVILLVRRLGMSEATQMVLRKGKSMVSSKAMRLDYSLAELREN
jgi:hypothetical protein